MTREERYKHALKWVNERRKEMSLRATSKLSKGYRGDPYNCTITRSLEKIGVRSTLCDATGQIELSGYDCEGKRSMLWFKDLEVARFMEDFDTGKYPELVIKPKSIKINKVVVLHGD